MAKKQAQPIVKGEDPKVAVEAQPQVQQPAEMPMRVVDAIPEGFRPVTDEEHAAMIEFGRQYETVLLRKRAVEAEMAVKQMEFNNVIAEIGGIKAMLDGIRNKLGVKTSADIAQDRKTGKFYVVSGVKAKKTVPSKKAVPTAEKPPVTPGETKK
jgi:hypothetical protein